MIRLDEYSYINSEKPFASVVFKHGDDKIEFTVRSVDDISMEVDGGVPLEAVEEAIAIVKSRRLEF